MAFLSDTTPPQRPGGVPALAEHGASVSANCGCRVVYGVTAVCASPEFDYLFAGLGT